MANQAAGAVKVVLSVEAASYSAAVDKAKNKLDELGGTSKKVSHGMVSDVQATSGALRILDGGISNNIRSAERFLASFKGISAALQAIYPGVGLIAVGAVIYKGVEALTEFVKKTREAATVFQSSLQEMVNASRLNNDELAKTNIELENQIAKLTGKHENVLASQLIDARIEADKLAMSAATAAKEMKDLLEKNQTGVLGSILGKGDTQDVFGNIENFQNIKAKAKQDAADALARGDQKGADKAQGDYAQYLKNERAYLLMQRDFRSGTGPRDGAFSGNQQPNLDAIAAALNLNYMQTDRIGLDAQHGKDAATVQRLKNAKDIEAYQRKVDEDHLRALEEQFEMQKSAAMMQPWESKTNFEQRQRLSQSNFFLGHLRDFRDPSVRKQALDLGQRPLDEYNTTDAEGRGALSKMLGGIGSSEGIFAGMGSGKDVQERLKAQRDAISAQAEVAAKLRESAIQHDLESGAISRYDASVQMAAVHTQQYQVQLERLAAEQEQLNHDETLNEEQRKSRQSDLNSRLGQLGQNRAAQIRLDSDSVTDQTPLGAWKSALDQFVQMSRDTASQIKEIWGSSLSAVNEEIVKIISTRHNYGVRREFGNIGAGIFRNIAGAGLGQAEGGLLKALGFGGGKPDGSQTKPFHVIMAGAAGAAHGAASAASSLGGWLGKIGGFFSGMGFADGGMPPVGMASLVGERGPELFVPRQAGSIIPNHVFASAAGGGVHFHPGAIDARGATDPAMVAAAAQRAIMKAAPALIAGSMRAQSEKQARRPGSSR